MSVERKKVLELQGVTACAGERYAMGLSEVSLCLANGEAVIITVSKAERITPLADLCCGLEDPVAGVVRFFGLPWSERSAAQMTLARGCIGRVWADSAWVGNLDMDENILLPQMHHTHRAAAEVREQARTLSQSFGLDDLPQTRPVWTPEKIRQKAQWVRALMGTPELLLLEYPDDDADEVDRVRLAAAVDQARTRGAAVLWITTRPAPVLADLPGAVRQAELAGGTLVCQTQENRVSNPRKG
jgi:phospholipid/cholesterol/gamma-HCH transport system ATP-binding protein